jgi:uncharacterized protein with HEPN domain
MSFRDWQLRIGDILNAIADINQWTSGKTMAEFEQAPILSQAILYKFIVVGEAAANIPDEIKIQYPNIPWRLMTDMRNAMAHEYFQIDLERVWNTLTYDLQPLVAELQQIPIDNDEECDRISQS